MKGRTQAASLTAAYYALVFFILGAHLPYWPVWLADWGLTEAEIGALIGWTTLARIAGSTFMPALADRFAIRRAMIVVTALGASAGAAALLAGVTDARWLLAVSLAGAVLMTPPIYLGEALGVRASERFGFSYPVVRAAGSAGFLAANLGVGALIGQTGPDIVLWIGVVGFVAVALTGLFHPGGGAAATTARDRTNRADLGVLVRQPVFLLFALAAALGQGGHAVYYAFSVLDWSARGITADVAGQLWAFSVAVETVFMLTVGRAWVTRLGPAHALALAACAGVLRWSVMALGPDGAALWALQGLHAFTFALGHLAAMAFLAAAIPPRMVATAQGISQGVVAGSVHAGALFAAGIVIAWGGIAAAYALSALMAGASALLAVLLARLWRGQTLVPDGEGPAELR